MAKIKGKGGPRADKINIKVSNGEYVLPADTTAKVGTDKLDKLVHETHEFPQTKEGEAKEREYAEGGIVNSALRWMGANIAPSIIGQSGMQSQAAVTASQQSAPPPPVQAPGSGLDEGARQRVLAARQALRTMNEGSYKPDYSKYADGGEVKTGWFGRLVGGATKVATDAGNNRQAQLDAAEAAATGPAPAPPPPKPSNQSDDPIAQKVRERLRKAGIEGYADGGLIDRAKDFLNQEVTIGGGAAPPPVAPDVAARVQANLRGQDKMLAIRGADSLTTHTPTGMGFEPNPKVEQGGIPDTTKNALDAKYGAAPPATTLRDSTPMEMMREPAPAGLDTTVTKNPITAREYADRNITRDGNSFSGVGTNAAPIKGLTDEQAKQQTADYVGSQLRAADIYRSMREPTGGGGGGMDAQDYGMAQNEINKRYDKLASDADSTFRSSKAQGNKINALAELEKQRGAELSKLDDTAAGMSNAALAASTKTTGRDQATDLALKKFEYDIQRDRANAERQSAQHEASLRQAGRRDDISAAKADEQARRSQVLEQQRAGREQRLAIDDAAKQAVGGDPEALAKLRAFEASNPDYKATNSPEDANAYAGGLKMQSDILDQANKDRSWWTMADTFLPDDVSPVEKRDFEPMSDPGKGTALRSYLTGSFGNNKVYVGKRGKVIRSSGLTPEQRAYMDEEHRKYKLRSQ